MIFLKHKEPQAEHVQFQRLISGLLVVAFVLTQHIQYIEVYIVLNVISLIVTVNHSPTTILFKVLSFLLRKPLFVTPPQYERSYRVNKIASILEDSMRIGGGVAIYYLFQISPLAANMLGSFMGIAMLISSFFGFCLSSLAYIGYKLIMKKCEK